MLAAMLAACGEPSPQQLLNDAKALTARGEGAAAVIQTKRLLALRPRDALVLVEASRIYIQAGSSLRRKRCSAAHRGWVPALSSCSPSLDGR